MKQEYDYGFLDYDYYGEYNHDPLYILIVNEQFKILRNSFHQLDDETKNIIDYFIIQRQSGDNIDIDNHIKRLKNEYLSMYN